MNKLLRCYFPIWSDSTVVVFLIQGLVKAYVQRDLLESVCLSGLDQAWVFHVLNLLIMFSYFSDSLFFYN